MRVFSTKDEVSAYVWNIRILKDLTASTEIPESRATGETGFFAGIQASPSHSIRLLFWERGAAVESRTRIRTDPPNSQLGVGDCKVAPVESRRLGSRFGALTTSMIWTESTLEDAAKATPARVGVQVTTW